MKTIDIFKEMIQNADDSCASEIHFICDKRTHGTDRVFNEKSKHIQGPSLNVYNKKKVCKTFVLDQNEIQIALLESLGLGSIQCIPSQTLQYPSQTRILLVSIHTENLWMLQNMSDPVASFIRIQILTVPTEM